LTFLYNDPATTQLYTLSLHDALPIFKREMYGDANQDVGRSLNNVAAALNDLGRHQEARVAQQRALATFERTLGAGHPLVALASRSEEHTSELQSLTNLVCRLLLENKN